MMERDIQLVVAFVAGYLFCAVWMGVWIWLMQ
jgi:hypothetical protein